MKLYLLIFLFITSLYSKDTIAWMVWDLPPNFILAGQKKGQGYQDIRLKMLQDRLPQYNHVSQVMNANRAFENYKEKNDSEVIYCTNDLVSHPDWDIDDYMSIATFPFKGYFLVTSKEKAHLFGVEAQTLLFKDIIKNDNLKLIISKNKIYMGVGQVIKEYLSKNPNQTHISSMSTLNIGKSMFAFVFKGRADYTLEYAFRAKYYAQDMGVLNKTSIFPIKENEGTFYGFVSCVRTIKGKEVINRVNEVLRVLKHTKQWMNPFLEWLPSQQFKDEYTKYYYDVFLKAGDIYDTNPRSK